jgi:3',5'-cyclic AMP phosphodiesterase CpdA
MQLVFDPPIPVKIEKMKQRLRWKDPIAAQKGIDRTRLVIDDGKSDRPEFSFLAIGDTGTGEQKYNAQRQVAEQMLPHLDSCNFVVHTGDVVYLVGSSEFYPENFIKPYRELLVGGERPKEIAYDRMVFKMPMFLVPGNHDYYDLPLIEGFLAGLTLPLRRQLRRFHLDFDVGWHGSDRGKAYARAFLDCWNQLKTRESLSQHLDRHYTSKTDTGYCLRYQPGEFTRLPNRYYTFRYGGIDFFALDSNTFNAPEPIADDPKGLAQRRFLQQKLDLLETEKFKLLQTADLLESEDTEQLRDLPHKLEQIEEMTLDIRKQLEMRGEPPIDVEQLNWLEQRLLHSWNTPEVRGRIVFFHHPPYVTEATKWNLSQTIAVRHHLQRVFDRVANQLGKDRGNRSIVDLVLNGHAHCLEYIRTFDTGHADSYSNWIVCGGSGYSLRRQRPEGSDLMRKIESDSERETELMARSQLFVGRNGYGSKKRRPYSFARIDVRAGTPPRFVFRPFTIERFQHQWHYNEVKSFNF